MNSAISIVARSALFILFAVASTFVVSRATSAQTDPMIGAWKLNVGKSSFSPGPPPRSLSVVLSAIAGGLRAEVEGIDAQGMPIRSVYINICDGQPHAATGDPTLDSSSCRRPDPYTMEFTGMRAGRAMSSATFVVSSDGKTSTFTAKGTNASGQPISDTYAYDRQ